MKYRNKYKYYLKICKELRFEFLNSIYQGYKFHIGGSLSCVELTTHILFNKKFKIFSDNNHFLLSKGHALGIYYLSLIKLKKLSLKKMKSMYKDGKLGGQLDIYSLKKLPHWNTGSLGHSIGVSIGLSLAKKKSKIWNIVGDAEFDEGSIWEALNYISEKRVKNIIIIIDRNKISATTKILKKNIFDSSLLNNLNMNLFKINGHNHKAIENVFLKAYKSFRSSIIIADTIKGKGFKEFENNLNYNHLLPEKKIIGKILSNYE